MRYIIAFLLVICGIIPFVVDGDITMLIFTFCISMYLIWSKWDWAKLEYGDPRRKRK